MKRSNAQSKQVRAVHATSLVVAITQVVNGGPAAANPYSAHVPIVSESARPLYPERSHIGTFGGDPNRVFVSGHSAGAYLSLIVRLD